MIIRAHQLHLSGFHLGQIQDIVDERQEISGSRLDVTGIIVHLPALALLHNDIAQSHNGIHGRAYLVGHIRQKLALRLIGLLRLYSDLLDFLNIVSHFRHVQDPYHIALYHPEPVRDLLHMTLVIPLSQKKLVLHILPENNFRKIRDLPDPPADGPAVQSSENGGRRRIIVDNPSPLIQCNHAVTHSVEQRTRCQTPEIVNLPAPHKNHHTRKHKPKDNRRKVKGARQFRDIGIQGNDRQKRQRQNQPVLAVHCILTSSGFGTDQHTQGHHIGDKRCTYDKDRIPRPILQKQIRVSIRRCLPVQISVEKAVVITGQN